MLTSYKGLHRNNKKQPLAQLLKHGNASQTTLNLKLFKAKMERGNYRMEGSFKNTRAIDTRCFSPPLNCKGSKITDFETLLLGPTGSDYSGFGMS